MHYVNEDSYTSDYSVDIHLISASCHSVHVMTAILEPLTGLATLAVSVIGSVYAYRVYDAFRKDVMRKVFTYLFAAFVLLGGAALILVVAMTLGAIDGIVDALILVNLVSFVLIIAGLIPILSWMRNTREAKSAL